MSLQQQKRKYKKRNFDQEAEQQIKILQQKAHEDFFFDFSQNEAISKQVIKSCSINTIMKQESTTQYREEREPKVYIPAKAKSILAKWMFEHRLYCYPTKTEKQALAIETDLSVQKISNWFINSRRRMLPKILQTEGRNPINFTISRKKKKALTAAPIANNTPTVCQVDPLTTYAIAEESKIIDQNYILFGHQFEHSNQQGDLIEKNLLEIIVPFTESDDEEVQPTYLISRERPETSDDQSNHITRGILYDQSTRSKCFFVIFNSLPFKPDLE